MGILHITSALSGPVQTRTEYWHSSVLSSGVPGHFTSYRDLSWTRPILSCSISLFVIPDWHTPVASLHYPGCMSTRCTPVPHEALTPMSCESSVPEKTQEKEVLQMLTVNVNTNHHQFYLLLDLSQRVSEPVANVGLAKRTQTELNRLETLRLTQVDGKKLMLILQKSG